MPFESFPDEEVQLIFKAIAKGGGVPFPDTLRHFSLDRATLENRFLDDRSRARSLSCLWGEEGLILLPQWPTKWSAGQLPLNCNSRRGHERVELEWADSIS